MHSSCDFTVASRSRYLQRRNHDFPFAALSSENIRFSRLSIITKKESAPYPARKAKAAAESVIDCGRPVMVSEKVDGELNISPTASPATAPTGNAMIDSI